MFEYLCAGPIQECQHMSTKCGRCYEGNATLYPYVAVGNCHWSSSETMLKCSNNTTCVMERTWICQILQLQCGPRKLHHLFDQRVLPWTCEVPDAIEHRNKCPSLVRLRQLFDSTVRCRTLNRALLVASAKLFEHTRGTAGHCSWAVENGFLYILLNRVEKGENSTQNNGSPILEAQLKQSVNCSDWESAPDTSSAWCTFSIKSNARFAGLLARAPNLALAFGFKA